MLHSVITFSSLLIILGVLVWLRKRKPYVISYLEAGTPNIGSYHESIKTSNRYFFHSEGRVDLKLHKELHRFRELYGHKEYLVEPWNRNDTLFLEEGKSKVVIFEFIETEKSGLIAIPCLRKVETVIHDDCDDPLKNYKETFLGVSWPEGQKTVRGENLFGIVRYESI